MKPQKVILYTQTDTDEDRPALLIACPICDTEAGLWCGLVETDNAGIHLFYVHSLRARRGAAVVKEERR